MTPPSQSATRQKIQSADYRTTAKRCGDTRRSVCHNGLLARIELVDQAVLGAIGEDVLQADILTAALDGAVARLTAATDPEELEKLMAHRSRIERECQRLTQAIALVAT